VDLSAIILRPARVGDYDFLWRLHRLALRPAVDAIWGWDEDFQARRFREHFDTAGLQIVSYRGQEVGAIKVLPEENSLFLAYIAILPVLQNQGIGTALIRQVLVEAARNDQPVTLQVLRGNPARRLYERLGFVITDQNDERCFMIHWLAQPPETEQLP
jgi:ribosomal protein S18 acetylase RimI-like enzyme